MRATFGCTCRRCAGPSGDGHAGSRYITNVTGRGYKFVAPIARAEATDLAPPEPDAAERSRNLPALD